MDVFQGSAMTQNSLLCSRFQEAETGLVPSVQDFDKKLAEADAYLQILIDQLKVSFVIICRHLDEICEEYYLCVYVFCQKMTTLAYCYWVLFFIIQLVSSVSLLIL